ncbi:beta-galactosidase, partial [bacterium]
MALSCGGLSLQARAQSRAVPGPSHRFAIGEKDFLIDGKPVVIRTGEMHFARVPREYWRHRLRLLKAMGMNAVCAYLFWNLH